MAGKGRFRSAIVGVRVSREAVDEVQDLITPPPPCLVPHPVRQNTANHSQGESRDKAQLPGGYQRSDRKQNERPRERHTNLVRKHRSEEDRVAMLHKKLGDRIHNEISSLSITCGPLGSMMEILNIAFLLAPVITATTMPIGRKPQPYDFSGERSLRCR